jgi:hypothetical protein
MNMLQEQERNVILEERVNEQRSLLLKKERVVKKLKRKRKFLTAEPSATHRQRRRRIAVESIKDTAYDIGLLFGGTTEDGNVMDKIAEGKTKVHPARCSVLGKKCLVHNSVYMRCKQYWDTARVCLN